MITYIFRLNFLIKIVPFHLEEKWFVSCESVMFSINITDLGVDIFHQPYIGLKSKTYKN